MIQTLIEVDVNKPAEAQAEVIHNRWHPDIPMAPAITPGDDLGGGV